MTTTTKATALKENTFSFLQKLGSALMLPIALLPIAGLFIGLSYSLPFLPVVLVDFLSTISLAIINNLPLLFLISISYTFSDKRKEVVIWAIIYYFIGIVVQSFYINGNDVLFYKDLPSYFFLSYSFFGYSFETITHLNMSLFSGFIYSFFFIITYKQLSKINFTSETKEYSSSILVYICSSIFFSSIIVLIWPAFYLGLLNFGTAFQSMPYGTDAFVYGFTNRLLLPFGMHSLLLPIFLYSPVGGVLMTSTGEVIAEGDSAIWLAATDLGIPMQVIREGGDISYAGVDYYVTPGTNPGQYQQGFLPIMIFGFPAAGWAMSRKTDNKKQKAIIMTAAITPLLTGITEPFEFLFAFTHPLLYLCHSLLVGLSFMLLDILNVSVWLSSGWIVDTILFGMLPQLNGSITNWWIIYGIGILFIPIYYFLFSILYNEKGRKYKY